MKSGERDDEGQKLTSGGRYRKQTADESGEADGNVEINVSDNSQS